MHIENIRRNSPCPCGSTKKYRNCCGTIEQLQENRPIKISADRIETFNAHNIVLLPQFLEEYLDKDFLEAKVKNFDTTGKKALEAEKYRKRFHPLCEYWKAMLEAIKNSQDAGRLKLNNQTIFLIDLFFSLRQAKHIDGFNDIIERIKDDNKFLSSCYELEVANYYLDLGMEVSVVPETNVQKTPDLLITTGKGKVYVEAKLLSDPKKQEQKHLPVLERLISKIITKHKKCLKIKLQAHRALGQKDHAEILSSIDSLCASPEHSHTVLTPSKCVTIYSDTICSWDHEFFDKYPIDDDFTTGDRASVHFQTTMLPNGRARFIQPHSINITQFNKINVSKTVKKNLENAKQKEVYDSPYIVHVGLPHDNAEQLLAVGDCVYQNICSNISEKINTVVVQGSSISSHPAAPHPIQRHIVAIPNFRSVTSFPDDFRLNSHAEMDWQFPEKGEISFEYHAQKLLDLLKHSFVGEIVWMTSKDARLQLRLVVTPTQSIRLEVICPEWGRVLFEFDMNSPEVKKGRELRVCWDENEVTTYIDGHRLGTQTTTNAR